jgi:predicted metal-dependent hydrolase
MELNGQQVEVIFHHKKTKHSYVRVKSPGIVHVTVGKNANEKRMKKHIIEHQHTILKRIESFKREAPYKVFGEEVQKVLIARDSFLYDEKHKVLYLPKKNSEQYLKKFEKELLLKTVNDMLEVFPHKELINIHNLTIQARYTTTVHGSCNAKKRKINLNLYLVRRNKEFLYYVLMHELAHLKVQNHSKAFYQVLDILCPNHKQIKRAMKRR